SNLCCSPLSNPGSMFSHRRPHFPASSGICRAVSWDGACNISRVKRRACGRKGKLLFCPLQGSLRGLTDPALRPGRPQTFWPAGLLRALERPGLPELGPLIGTGFLPPDVWGETIFWEIAMFYRYQVAGI